MSTRLNRLVRRAFFVTVGSIAIGVAATQAADPFAAGQRSTEERALLPGPASDVAERARAIGRVLGFPAGAVHTARIVDRFEQREVDRATFAAADGRELAVVEFADDGLHLALRLGTGPGKGPKLPAERALAQARGFARDLGFDVAGQPIVDDNPSIGGWLVFWPRAVDGFTVKGDGIRVGLGTAGTFDSFSRWEHRLAPRPAAIAADAVARSTAEEWLRRRFGTSAAAYAVTDMTVMWVAPNDTWDPAKPDAPEPVRRLAWVVRADAVDPVTAPVRAIQVWLDAGDLTVIGGDVAE